MATHYIIISAEDQFMPAWYDFEPEWSRKWLMKKLTNKEKEEEQMENEWRTKYEKKKSRDKDRKRKNSNTSRKLEMKKLERK